MFLFRKKMLNTNLILHKILCKLINKLFKNIPVVLGIPLPTFWCSAVPVAIKVPSPSFWPRHVKLSRCMGTVPAPDIFECGVDIEDHFLLKVMLNQSDQKFSGLVPMINHTSCSNWNCIKKEEDCNSNTHELDPSTCQCNCRDDVQCGPLKVLLWVSRICPLHTTYTRNNLQIHLLLC